MYNWSLFWGSRFERKSQDDPQDGAAGISRRINKVLAIICLFSDVDSKWTVKKVVWRKKQNKGGGRFLIQGGYYTYVCVCVYIYIYIYISTQYFWFIQGHLYEASLDKPKVGESFSNLF